MDRIGRYNKKCKDKIIQQETVDEDTDTSNNPDAQLKTKGVAWDSKKDMGYGTKYMKDKKVVATYNANSGDLDIEEDIDPQRLSKVMKTKGDGSIPKEVGSGKKYKQVMKKDV